MHATLIKEIEENIKKGKRSQKFSLDQPNIGTGEKTRLYRLMYEHGPGNGKMMFLPIDQGLEHGPVDFFPNPAAADFEFQLALADEGKYSAVVCHIGLAEKHMHKWAGKVPLVLKINGKTVIPPDDEAFSPLDATVEDAVRLGADAVGYTLFVGSPRQDEDFAQFLQVKTEARAFGIPIIVWAYPRGVYAKQAGGIDSLAMVDYAARVANELGAHIVKLNLPKDPKGGSYPEGRFKQYDQFVGEAEEKQLERVIESAGRTGVLVSGGSRMDNEALLKKVEDCMAAGADGLIFGRNMWQRPYEEAVKMSHKIFDIMSKY
ncbi:MAG: fructose-bisphosphate aldolase [Chloroflexi bacterium]|nr:fructose-bisphosphate aldolase [Chloroflexota bacterium]